MPKPQRRPEVVRDDPRPNDKGVFSRLVFSFVIGVATSLVAGVVGYIIGRVVPLWSSDALMLKSLDQRDPAAYYGMLATQHGLIAASVGFVAGAAVAALCQRR